LFGPAGSATTHDNYWLIVTTTIVLQYFLHWKNQTTTSRSERLILKGKERALLMSSNVSWWVNVRYIRVYDSFLAVCYVDVHVTVPEVKKEGRVWQNNRPASAMSVGVDRTWYLDSRFQVLVVKLWSNTHTQTARLFPVGESVIHSP
jgi:hypothetical protein